MSDSVFYGVWINWSRGKYNGSTITLTPQSSGFLVAFLAIFVSVAGGSLWRLIAFALHQRQATTRSMDGLHYQHQNILRNAATPGVAAWQFLWLVPPWTKRSKRPFLRTLPLVIIALVNLSVFFAAGVLVAEVTRTTGNDVLVRSAGCGNWTLDTVELVDGFHTKTLNDTLAASSYAKACYGGQSKALECNQYATQALPYTITKQNQSEACPFADGMCLIKSPVITLDTGNVSSHYHLGFNAKPEDRITYRRRTVCAPLKTTGFITTFNYTDAVNASLGDGFFGFDGDVIDFYNFGPRLDKTGNVSSNFTMAFNRRLAGMGIGYSMSVSEYNSGNTDNRWTPDAAILRNDADTSLMFVSANDIQYYGNITDPIFQATEMIGWKMDNGKNVSYYTSNYYVNPMGCVDQHQFCNPMTQKCTVLDSFDTAVRAAQRNLQYNPMQYVTISVLSLDLYLANIAGSIGGRGAAALRAQEQLAGRLSSPLPSTQWMKEVEYWFTIGLSKLQRHTVEYATGPTNVLDGTHVSKPTDTPSRQLCNSQVIKAPAGSGATSFSTLGVSIILGIGGLLILVHTILEYVVINIIQGRGYKLMRWAMDEKLQLQRQAFEGAGLGTWKSGVEAVPVTLERDVFGIDVRGHEEKHPRFYRYYGENADVENPSNTSNSDTKGLTETRTEWVAQTPTSRDGAATDFSRGLSLTSEPIDWPYTPTEERRAEH